jgi:MraZ protein
VEPFISTFVNKVDRKGRVSVPVTFRAALAGQHFNGIVIIPSYRYEMLEGMSGDYMLRLRDSLNMLERGSQEFENLSIVFADAQQLGFDPEGRVVLPETLKTHAGITAEAAFVGRGPSFEIWEPGRFAEHRRTILARGLAAAQTWPAQGPGGAAP